MVSRCQLVFLDFSLWCCSRISELVIIWSIYFIRILSEYVFLLYRPQKLEMLRRVMGADGNHDPDPTYELTIDNMKKLLAVHVRLRYSCMITGFLARFILLYKRITINIYQLIPLHSCDYVKKLSIQINMASDKGNSRNEM